LEAEARRAKVALDTEEARLVIALAMTRLRSSEARAFLDAVPSPETLIPALDVAEIMPKALAR
jgi:hypothetical protein